MKFALIHIGTDEVYGLEFVATELKLHGHQIQWFDGDLDEAVADVLAWEADFLCLSPLTTYFQATLDFSRKVKAERPGIQSIFGGHHVMALPDVIELDGVDKIVIGPAYGTIESIVDPDSERVLRGQAVPVERMVPSRREYFEAVPSIGGRHKKTIMTHFGCPYRCSYCSTPRLKVEFGARDYKESWLKRRPIKDIIDEARVCMEFPTMEIALEDDDMLFGKDTNEWLPEFASEWKQHIGLPMVGNATPNTVVRVSDETLDTMKGLVTTVQMGVQAARKDTLRLYNRQFQNEDQVAEAVRRLTSRGIPVKLELIVGAPVDDPVGDAIDSIKLAQRVGAGTFVVAFPLMLYPGTELQQWCSENGVETREDCSFECYEGVGSVRFEPEVQRKLRNISKLASFFVKFNVDERWMRTLIEMDLNDTSARKIAESTYYESLRFTLGDQIDQEFDAILASTKFRY